MSASDSPLEGRVALVTGATSGIGQATALGLARAGARVVIVGRNALRAETTRAYVSEQSGSSAVDVLLCDLACLDQVRGLADTVLDRYPALHLLVNNAGLVNLRREVTVDGYESTFAVNHLAPFLLTLRLLDRLLASAPARVVNVSSEAHRFGPVDFDDLQSERRFGFPAILNAMRVYGMSKLANVLFTAELARRTEGRGILANSLHPGAVATQLGMNNGWAASTIGAVLRPFMKTPAQGAETSLHLALAPESELGSGRYFADSRQRRPSDAAQDADAARRLWRVSCQLVGLPEDA